MPGQSEIYDETEPRLAICCVSKPGSENMEDWINHHVDMGFDRIFLYNDGSIDELKEYMEKYPDRYCSEKVEIVDFPSNPDKDNIVASYADCYRKNRKNLEWMAFISQREYIVSSKKENVKNILGRKEFNKFDAVRLNIVDFTNYQRLERDFDLDQYGDYSMDKDTEQNGKFARSIVNCNTQGILLGRYAPTRNGQAIRQCLPNLQPVIGNKSDNAMAGAEVDKIDTSVLYVTTSKLEAMWRRNFT